MSGSTERARQKSERPNKELKLTKPSIMELRSLTPVLDGPVAGPRNGRVGPASLRTNSRCLSSAAFTGSVQQSRAGAAVAASASCLRWLGPRIASLFSEARAPCVNVALALLKLKSRRSPATRLLSARGGRGFQEATEGVALQRRLCLAPASHRGAQARTLGVGVTMFAVAGRSKLRLRRLTTLGGTTGPSNNELKLTKLEHIGASQLNSVLG